MSKVIDLTYVKNEQKAFLEHLKSIKGIDHQEDKFNVPMWLTLALLSELIEILNETKIHKWWDASLVDENKLKEELSDFMAHLGNLANELDTPMIVTIEETQTTEIERQFINIAYKITTLPWRKLFGKHKLDTLLAQFIELVYSLGFNMDEVEVAYKSKMKSNYSRFI